MSRAGRHRATFKDHESPVSVIICCFVLDHDDLEIIINITACPCLYVDIKPSKQRIFSHTFSAWPYQLPCLVDWCLLLSRIWPLTRVLASACNIPMYYTASLGKYRRSINPIKTTIASFCRIPQAIKLSFASCMFGTNAAEGAVVPLHKWCAYNSISTSTRGGNVGVCWDKRLVGKAISSKAYK